MDISAYGSDRNRSVTTSNNTSYNTAFQKMEANAEANLCSFRFSFSVQCMHQICSSDKSNTPNNQAISTGASISAPILLPSSSSCWVIETNNYVVWCDFTLLVITETKLLIQKAMEYLAARTCRGRRFRWGQQTVQGRGELSCWRRGSRTTSDLIPIAAAAAGGGGRRRRAWAPLVAGEWVGGKKADAPPAWVVESFTGAPPDDLAGD